MNKKLLQIELDRHTFQCLDGLMGHLLAELVLYKTSWNTRPPDQDLPKVLQCRNTIDWVLAIVLVAMYVVFFYSGVINENLTTLYYHRVMFIGTLERHVWFRWLHISVFDNRWRTI